MWPFEKHHVWRKAIFVLVIIRTYHLTWYLLILTIFQMQVVIMESSLRGLNKLKTSYTLISAVLSLFSWFSTYIDYFQHCLSSESLFYILSWRTVCLPSSVLGSELFCQLYSLTKYFIKYDMTLSILAYTNFCWDSRCPNAL